MSVSVKATLLHIEKIDEQAPPIHTFYLLVQRGLVPAIGAHQRFLLHRIFRTRCLTVNVYNQYVFNEHGQLDKARDAHDAGMSRRVDGQSRTHSRSCGLDLWNSARMYILQFSCHGCVRFCENILCKSADLERKKPISSIRDLSTTLSVLVVCFQDTKINTSTLFLRALLPSI